MYIIYVIFYVAKFSTVFTNENDQLLQLILTTPTDINPSDEFAGFLQSS